jgi:pre-mRNA-splicing factor 18
MREWEVELDQRPTAEKKTTRGKVASATQKQSRQYIRPFFKHLKARV